MKTLLFTLLALSISVQQVFAVACSSIQISGFVTYHNWSNSTYDVSDHSITVGTDKYDVSALTIQSGSLMVPAGGSITFGGFSFKTASADPNSVALWATSDTTFATGAMVDFVQYGAANQPFEAKAVASSLWQAGDYIAGEPNYQRNTYNFIFPMSAEWTALDDQGTGIASHGLIDNIDLTITPNPFQTHISVQVAGNADFDVSVQLFNTNGAVLDKVDGIRENNVPFAAGIELPSGVYFIRVETLDGSYITRKVLKY